MKTYLLIIIVSINLFFINHVYSQQIPVISIDSVVTSDLQYGDTINVAVRALNFNGIGSMGLVISFNANVLAFDNITNFFPGLENLICNYKYPYLYIAWVGSHKVSLPKNKLFDIKFIYRKGFSNINFYVKECSVADYNSGDAKEIIYKNGFLINLPEGFRIYSPVDNIYTNSTPKFFWTQSPGAVFYNLYIDNKLIKDSIYGLSYKLPKAESLAAGNHSCYVTAYDKVSLKQTDNTGSFQVDNSPLPAINLIYPENNVHTDYCHFGFKWDKIQSKHGIAYYEVTLSGLKSFIFTPLDSAYIYVGIYYDVPYGTYKWNVKAVDSIGNEVVSETYNLVLEQKGDYVISGNVYYGTRHKTNGKLRVKVYLKTESGNIIDSTYSDNGSYSFSKVYNGNFIIEAKEEAPAAGVTPLDAYMVYRNSQKNYIFQDTMLEKAADVNDDNIISPADAEEINKYYVYKLKSNNLGSWYFPAINICLFCMNLKIDIYGICYGDVNTSKKN